MSGRAVTARAGEAHFVLRGFLQIDAGHVERNVGREIGRRIVHLVEDLLGDGVAIDAPAAAGRLGDGDRAVVAHLRDRKADAVDVRHVLQAGLGEIAAGRLPAAFEQVPGEHAAAIASLSSACQPSVAMIGPSASAESVTRPVTITSAPAA